MNERKLKAKCIEKGYSISEIADKICVAPSTFYKKMDNESFSIKEVNSIIECLELNHDEVMAIFFEKQVA